MSTVAYLPSRAPKDNNQLQLRRRVNDMAHTVSEQVGSIATGTGDLGTLATTKANATNPALSGTVALSSAPTATAATAGAASALPATPLGYLTVVVNGVNVKLPYYSV